MGTDGQEKNSHGLQVVAEMRPHSPHELRTKSEIISRFIDAGDRNYQEDGVFIDFKRKLAFIVDGMGGAGKPGDGGRSCQIALNVLKAGITSIKDFHQKTHAQLRQAGILEGGFAYIAVDYNTNPPQFYQAGDSRGALIRGAQILAETRDEEDRYQALTNCIMGKSPGRVSQTPLPMMFPGDILLLGSDGFWGFVDQNRRKYLPLLASNANAGIQTIYADFKARRFTGADNISCIAIKIPEKERTDGFKIGALNWFRK